MSTTESTAQGAERLIGSIEHAEQATLEAIRRFVDTVDSTVPDAGDDEDGPRRQIIDSAFSMVESLVSTSNRLAQNVVDVTERALREGGGADEGS